MTLKLCQYREMLSAPSGPATNAQKNHCQQECRINSQNALGDVRPETRRSHPACGHEKTADDKEKIHAAAADQGGKAFAKVGLPPAHAKQQKERVIKQHQRRKHKTQKIKVIQAVV